MSRTASGDGRTDLKALHHLARERWRTRSRLGDPLSSVGFRELVFSGEQQGAPVVAQALRDAKTSESDLEHALSLAFRSLGFEVTKNRGKGKPDGLVRARLRVARRRRRSATTTS